MAAIAGRRDRRAPVEPRNRLGEAADCRYAGFSCLGELTPWNRRYSRALLDATPQNSWLCLLMITDLFGSNPRYKHPGAVAASNGANSPPRHPPLYLRRDPVLSKKFNASPTRAEERAFRCCVSALAFISARTISSRRDEGAVVVALVTDSCRNCGRVCGARAKNGRSPRNHNEFGVHLASQLEAA